MKALFAHELKFYENNGKLYLRGYDSDFWNRYLNNFNELFVIGRKIYINSDKEIKGYNEFHGDKLRFVEVPEIHNPRDYFSNIKKTNYIIKSLVKKVDFVIARLPGTYSTLTIKHCKNYKKSYLVELVGCPWDAYRYHSVKGKILAPVMATSTKRIIKKSPFVIYVTNNFLQSRYPSEGETISCSDVSLQPVNQNVLTNRINKIKNLDFKREPIVLGTIGAVNLSYKGQAYVIKAISKLNRIGKKFEYHLVGGGDNSKLKRLVEKYELNDYVKFLGSLPHEKVFSFLDNIDIYIQPSKTEGLPRALIEALSRGCPALGSNTGGIPELINREFLFKPGSVKDIYKLLKNMSMNTLLNEAKLNFEKAKAFEQNLLNKKRDIFYKKFVECGEKNDKGTAFRK